MICGMLMPVVMEFNMPVAAPTYAMAARAIGLDGPDDAAAAQALLEWFRQLISDLRITRPLDAYGLTESHYETIIEQALASGSTKHNPREVTPEDLKRMLDRLRMGE